MRRKILFAPMIGVALALLLVSASGPGPADAADPDKILVGASVPISGRMAAFGGGIRFGLQSAVEDINKQGGVVVKQYGKKLPLELIMQDSESDPVKAASTAGDLILRHKVHILAGGSVEPPTTINPISVQADRFEIPLVAGTPFEPWLAAGPWKYAWNTGFRVATKVPENDFRAGFKGFTIFECTLGVVGEFIDQTNGVIGILAADDVDGRVWYGMYGPGIIEAGFAAPIGFKDRLGLFPPGTMDFAPIINEWKAKNVEIVLGNAPGVDAAVFLRQARAMAFEPKILLISRAGLFYEDVSSWGGDLPHGAMVSTWWDYTYPHAFAPGFGGTTGRSLFERWQQATGLPLNRSMGPSYASIQIIVNAIERAGTLDKKALNEAIAKTDMPTLSHQRVKFTEKHNSPLPIFIAQWVKTDQPKPRDWMGQIVYSPHDWYEPEAKVVFPRAPLR